MLTRRLLQQPAAGLLSAAALVECGLPQRTFSAVPQHADSDDELVSKASRALEEIKAAGTLKVERQITTPQAASVGERPLASASLVRHTHTHTHTRGSTGQQQNLTPLPNAHTPSARLCPCVQVCLTGRALCSTFVPTTTWGSATTLQWWPQPRRRWTVTALGCPQSGSSAAHR